MDTKRLILVLIILALLGCSPQAIKTNNLENINFNNYAYAICIGSAFDTSEVKEDANRSANGHMEHGNISLDAYQELRDRVDIWLAKNYVSKSGKSLQIMKCNDFYNSGEIQKIYHQYDPCKSRMMKSSFFVNCVLLLLHILAVR